MADNITDPELGILYFVDRETNELLNTVVNYAAHPLTGQSEGYSSHLISADYPGVLRREVEVHLGGKCIFITGACGDLHPRNFECGFSRTEKMGKAIAKMVIDGFADAIGSPEKYQLRNTVLKSKSILFKLPFRKTRCIEGRLPLYEGQDFAWAEVQFLAIGDIVLIGMPGELLSGPGLEIKWNSPFTKSLILYNSTSYLSYMPARNCFVQGGYEAETCHMDEMATFELVVKTVKALQRFAQHD